MAFGAVWIHEEENDPDFPRSMKGKISEDEYIRLRNEYVQMRLGMTPGQPYDPMVRVQAVQNMERQEAKLREDTKRGLMQPEISGTAWTNLGPYPIPNGQTESVVTAVSGRVTAIAIHPTNPNIAYVGAAQGGVYRTTDGGATWTQLFNSAQSLAIGTISIAPSNPDIVYVGTGEPNLCGSGCYAGVGIYRIDNASTTANLVGPINPSITTGSTTTVTYNCFNGRAISKILVKPDDPATIFVATTSAIIGNPNQAPGGNAVPPNALRGVFRSSNATAAAGSVTFTKLIVTAQPGGFDVPSTGNRSITDLAFDPGDATSNTVIAWVLGAAAAGDGGAYRSTNALTTGTFTQTLTTATANARASFAVNRVGGVTTVIMGSAETGVLAGCTGAGQGVLRKSVDGGATWSAKLNAGSGYCGGQCFYDQPVAIDPTDPNIVYVGGNTTGTCNRLLGKSTGDVALAGTTFTAKSTGLHADNHVIAIAPSNPSIIYDGNDGGIWRSIDGGDNWTDLNNTTFVATQYQSLAMHPTDRWFTIGGTQDNGTHFLQPNAPMLPFAGWTRADFGDGGYARIDQTATDTTNVVMYHTYFNQANNLIGFARVNLTSCATEGQWSFKGIYGGAVDTTVHCDGTTDTFNGIAISNATLFYAPLELGPSPGAGQPQNVYFGTDRLYRSVDKGDTMTVVSSVANAALVAGVPITTIGISPTNDAVRIVGLNNGNVFATTTGGAVGAAMTNVSPPVTPNAPSVIPAVGKVVIDPNNPFTAYVAYDGQNIPAGQHFWKTTNLNAGAPTWTPATSGLSDVPINAIAVDPANSSKVYVGTDIGVFVSLDGGANFIPFGTGLPRVAVFDMAIQNANRILRIATHGRGMWEITPLSPTAAPASISGRITTSDGAPLAGVTMNLSGARTARAITDSNGNYTFANNNTDSFYTVTPSLTNYHFGPEDRSFSLVANKTDAVFTATRDAVGGGNAIDSAGFFVRQHYLDFLGREPDESGFNFWSDQILSCGNDAACIERRTINVSAAYFLSIEFQQTGGLVDGLYRASYGRAPHYAEFMPDTSTLAHNVVVGRSDWAQTLEANKQAFIDAWMQRADFRAAYDGLANAAYVDTLIAHAGAGFNGDRATLVNGLNGNTLTRSAVLREVVENEGFVTAKRNEMFVMMEYFGYLRRDPDAAGYQFWLNKLNQFNGNFEQAEMVKAFLVSGEYRSRFLQ